MTSVNPVKGNERIYSLDVLRGFALLGILIMNIQAFSMISAAYMNPMAFGSLVGWNKWVWVISHVFADQKFMALFSMFFGAGVCLFCSKIESKGNSAGKLHYLRTFWLLVFGFIHAYVFWHGDILVTYAICGFFLYLFRNKSPRSLVIWGCGFLSITVLVYLFFAWSVPYIPEANKLEMTTNWKPTNEMVQEELKAFRSGWKQQQPFRMENSIMFQTFILAIFTFWRTMGMMLIGMALFKSKVLHASKSKRYYLAMASLVVPGVVISLYGVQQNFLHDWEMEYSMFQGFLYNYVGSALTALGYIGVILLLYGVAIFGLINKMLAAIGRTALSNYFLQTIICTLFFYGHGLGFFGYLNRIEQIMFVAMVWAIQMIVSVFWLKVFRFGPFEWLWRCLTYRKIYPIWRQAY